MDATFSRSALEPLQPVLLAFLWLSLAGLLVVDLMLPDIPLLPFYSIPALIGAVIVSTRQVLLLSLAGLACGLYVGVHFGFLGTADYLVRLAAVFGIVVLAVVLTAARNRQIEEIESERARVRATLDSLLDPHILMRAMRDAGGKITDFLIADANDAACLYNRLPRSGFVGHRLLELLPAHVATGLLDLYRRAIESGRPLVLDDYLYPHDILEEPRYYDIRGVKVGDALSFT